MGSQQKTVEPEQIWTGNFDAEVSLMKSLGRNRISHAKENMYSSALCQKTTSSPFLDGDATEKPAAVAGKVESAREEGRRNRIKAKHSVKALSKYHRPSATGVTYEKIQAMQESRKERHQAAMELYTSTVQRIHTDLEIHVAEVSKAFHIRMDENDKEWSRRFKQLDDEYLVNMDKGAVDEAWQEVIEMCSSRTNWIDDLDAELEHTEQNRMGHIRDELSNLGECLIDTAMISQGDVQRFMEQEAEQLNLVMLQNRKAYVDLLARLRKKEIDREKTQLMNFEERRERWRQLRHERARREFDEEIGSDYYQQPRERTRLFGIVKYQQKCLLEQIVDNLSDIGKLSPPELTTPRMKKLRAVLTDLHDFTEETLLKYVVAIRAHDESLDGEAQKRLERLRSELAFYAAVSPEVMEREVEDECAPKLVERRKFVEGLLERVEESIKLQQSLIRKTSMRYIDYFSEAAKIWDECRDSTIRINNETEEKHMALRTEHERLDREAETELEATVHQMKNDALDSALKQSLDKALDLLANIELGYRDFWDKSMTTAREHPVIVADNILDLEIKMADFFGLIHPAVAEKRKAEEEEKRKEEEEAAAAAAATSKPAKGDKGGGKKGAKDAAVEEEPEEEPEEEEEEEDVEDETVVTSVKGLSFKVDRPVDQVDEWYCVEDPRLVEQRKQEEAEAEAEAEAAAAEAAASGKKGDKKSAAAAKKAAEAEVSESHAEGEGEGEGEGEVDLMPQIPFALVVPKDLNEEEAILGQRIPENLLNGLRKELRRTMVNHFSKFNDTVAIANEKEFKAIEESVTDELDHRLRAHRPRAGRMELDIYQQCAQDLDQHRMRYDRHSRAVFLRREALVKQLRQQMANSQDALEKHLQRLGKVEAQLDAATNTDTLKRLLRDGENAHMVFIESGLQQSVIEGLNASLDGILEAISHTNKLYLESLGGYNAEEVAIFTARTEELMRQTEVECTVLREEVEQLTASVKERAESCIEAFRKEHSYHMEDMVLVESLALTNNSCLARVRAGFASSDVACNTIEQKIAQLHRLVHDDYYDDEEDQVEADRAKSLIMLMNELRCLVFERATFLDCLQSKMQVDKLHLQLDPPSDPESEVYGNQSTPRPQRTIVDLAKEVQTECKQRLLEVCRPYYQKKDPERDIKRPNKIPDTLQEHEEEIEKTAMHLVELAQLHRANGVKVFRHQLEVLFQEMVDLPAALMDDIAAFAIFRDTKETSKVLAEYKVEREAMEQQRVSHEEELKPTMSNPTMTPAVDDLAAREEKRIVANLECIQLYTQQLLDKCTSNGATFLARLSYVFKLSLAIFDSTVLVEDLVPGDEPVVPKAKSYRRLLKDQAREVTSAANKLAPLEGRPFPRRIWKLLPDNELTVEAVLASEEDGLSGAAELLTARTSKSEAESELVEKETPAKGGKGGKKEAPAKGKGGKEPPKKGTTPRKDEAPDGTIISNRTAAHRALVTARDHCYRSFRDYCQSFIRETSKAGVLDIQSVQQWRKNWQEMVSQLRF